MADKSHNSFKTLCNLCSLPHWHMLRGILKCVCCILLQPIWSPMLSRWETQYPVLYWYHLVVHHESCCTSYESSAKEGGAWRHGLTAATRRPSVPPCGETKNATRCISWMNNWMTTNLPLSWLYMNTTTWYISAFLQQVIKKHLLWHLCNMPFTLFIIELLYIVQ